MPQSRSAKSFLATPAGKIALTAFATLALVGSFLELGVLIALATFLLLLLAVPLYLGWRRPRELALAAILAIVVAAPLTTLVYTQELRSPVGPVSSAATHGGSVLSDAYVSPFAGATGTSFQFHVTIDPQYLPNGSHGPEYLIVFLSTCAGATTPNNAACPGGNYPFWELNHTFASAVNTTTDVVVAQTLQMSNLWWWLMAFVYNDSTNATYHAGWVWVGLSDQGSGVQGPISGDFASTFVLILPTLYEAYALYFGLVYLAALVIYLFLKSREARRNPPPTGSAPTLPPSTGARGTTASPGKPSIERSCPSCGAVVYPEEKACWKCGTALELPKSPGPSGPSPPLS